MPVSFLKMWLKTLINEEINKDQLTSTSKALNKSEEYLRHWITKTDPTSNQGFSVWLLRGLKKQWIQMEDGYRVKQALERFIQLRRINRIGDIMQFPQINDLENAIDQLTGMGAKRQGFSGIDPTTLPGVSLLEERPQQGITFYKVTDPVSLSKMGEGTKWCTRFSYDNNTKYAENYIRWHKYLVIGYKEGKPFIQFNPDYSQVMDVNDVSFKNSKEINPQSLELPPPEFLNKPLPRTIKPTRKIKLIRPVEPKREKTGSFLTPLQQQLKNWMSFTYKQNPKWHEFIQPRYRNQRTASTVGKDLDYETRLARSLLKTKNHENFSKMIEAFAEYAKEELEPGERSPIVEKALLEKNFDDIKQNFGINSKRGKKDKRALINGLQAIAYYVKHNIRGNWPEFERKLQNDPYNSISYYNWAELNPDYIEGSLTKDVIIFSRMMAAGRPTIPTKEFNNTIKDFFERSRAQWKYTNFSAVVHNVIEPYLELTEQKLQDVVGNELAQSVARNFKIGRASVYWEPKKK